MLDARFPEQLKSAVLKSVQWQLVGRLDHLVEAVYDRFKDRYFEGERVFVDFSTATTEEDHKETTGRSRYWTRITAVIPPLKGKAPNGKRKAAQMENGDMEDRPAPHDIYGDLKIPVAQVNAVDDPLAYTYQVQLVEEGPNGTYTVVQPATHGDFRNGATVMNIHCDVISRDRLAFSKSILKRFIRECVDRDAAVGSPWVVKNDIAIKYHINQQMPDDIKKGVDAVKRSESEKRKRPSEVKENPAPVKRPKRTKPPMTEEEKAMKVKDEAAAKAKRERDETQRQALTGCKKPVTRWPIEDLDVILTEKEKASGKPVVRPLPHRVGEFSAPESFEPFLMAWNFVTTYGRAFNVSPFTLDVLEAALHHNTEPCFLIDTLHTGVISSCRSVSAGMTKTQQAISSLLVEYEDEMETGEEVDIQTLVQSLSAFGSGWEKKAVNHETWCNALVSILKEHATVQIMPNLRPVLSHLLFQPNTEGENTMKVDNAEEDNPAAWVPAKPRERYYSLSFHLKVSILAFLCDLSATGKAVHNTMETCEATLTELRKEKVELKRQQKKVADQLQALAADKKKASPQKNGTGTPKESAAPKVNGKGKKKSGSMEQDVDGTPPPESQDSDHDSEDLLAANVADLTMDTTASEAPSDELMGSASTSDIVFTPSRSGARTPRSSLRFKAQDQARVANKKKKEKDTEKVKDEPSGLSKQEEDELRQYEDEATKVEQGLETLELEFRQYLLLPRMRPLGKDRFHCKVWWFDGVGCMTLRGNDGEIQYGTGKIFIQGPSQDDLALIDAKTEADPSVGLRREAEEGTGLLAPGEWSWYETPEEVEAYLQWLNPKGIRENALDKAFTQWRPYILGGMQARLKDLAASAKPAEPRRGRKSNAVANAEAKTSYLSYTNLYATK